MGRGQNKGEIKHRAGGKITGSHTTAIPAACSVIDLAEKLDKITKTSLGRITPASGGGNLLRIKFKKIEAGLKATVRGRRNVQIIRFYTSSKQPEDLDALIKQLSQRFHKKNNKGKSRRSKKVS